MADGQTAFSRLAAALGGKPPQGGGTGDASKRDARPVSMSPREANMAKMKALGLESMPGGGQDELDSMYADHVKKVTGAK